MPPNSDTLEASVIHWLWQTRTAPRRGLTAGLVPAGEPSNTEDDQMDDLADRFPASLVPSSMNAGNTVADEPALAMTAPGLPSVLAVPETTDRLPMPVLPTDRIPVNFPVQPWETVPGGGGFEPDAWQMTSTSQDHRGHHPHQRSSSPN